MENNETIGAKIFALRKSRGITQADLGTHLNISYQAVSKWERDESIPDFETLSRIAQYFNVPITYFEKGYKESEANQATIEAALAAAQKSDGKKMIGVCKDCGKVVYEGEEGQTSPTLSCKICVERNKRIAKEQLEENKRKLAEIKRKQEELEKKEKQRKEELARIEKYKKINSRNKGLIRGGVWSILLLILFIFSLCGEWKDFGTAIVDIFITLILSAFVFTFVSQLYWDGAVVSCCTAGAIIGTPGVIFTFDLDGFLFLIGIKLLFALLRLGIFLLTSAVCIFVGILISPFTFFPAMARVMEEGVID